MTWPLRVPQRERRKHATRAEHTPSAPKPQRKLTPRQANFAKNLIKGMSKTEAAIKAGYSSHCAAQAGHQALEQIRAKMPEVLDRHGLTDDALIEKYLAPALKAKNKVFTSWEGSFTDEREVPAWTQRLTALDMAFNLKGSYAPKAVPGALPLAIQIVTNVSFPDD